MNFRLITLDLDGTLLNQDHSISRATLATIKKIQKKGMEVIIATGRMLVSALPYASTIGLSGPIITYNGAYVKDIGKDEILYHKPLDCELAKTIIRDAEEKKLQMNLYLDDKLYVKERNELVELYEEISGIRANYVGRLSSFIDRDPTKLLIIENSREKQQYYLKYYREKYREQIEVTESQYNFIEIGAIGVSKGDALAHVADTMGIKSSEVIAIGDGWNDYEMLKWAGLGIVMGNASADLKEKIDTIAPPNSEEGVSRVLTEVLGLE